MKKIALITGAAGGIGQSITHKLAETLDGLILVDIDVSRLKNLYHTLDHQLPKLYLECDLANEKNIQHAIANIQEHFEIPNILINNAGYGGPFVKLDKLTSKDWQRILNINLTSIFYLSKFLLPHMQQQGFGRIINIASMQGLFGGIGSCAYVAAKHGVIGLSKTIAAEWGEFGINCNAICPGYVDSPMGPERKTRPKLLKKFHLNA